MYTGKTLFAQILDFLPWKTFHRMVEKYGANHRVRTLSAADHLRVLAFAQLTYRESLRDIEACLAAQSAKLYHMGIRAPIKRSTLADANERREAILGYNLDDVLATRRLEIWFRENFTGELLVEL